MTAIHHSVCRLCNGARSRLFARTITAYVAVILLMFLASGCFSLAAHHAMESGPRACFPPKSYDQAYLRGDRLRLAFTGKDSTKYFATCEIPTNECPLPASPHYEINSTTFRGTRGWTNVPLFVVDTHVKEVYPMDKQSQMQTHLAGMAFSGSCMVVVERFVTDEALRLSKSTGRPPEGWFAICGSRQSGMIAIRRTSDHDERVDFVGITEGDCWADRPPFVVRALCMTTAVVTDVVLIPVYVVLALWPREPLIHD